MENLKENLIPSEQNRTSVAVKLWSSSQSVVGEECYCEAPDFVMEVTDMRASYGQLDVDVASVQGDLDDIMCTTFEINTIPGTDIDTQCLHLSFNGDAQAMTVFRK